MSHFPSYSSICYVDILHVRANDRIHFHFIHTSVALHAHENYKNSSSLLLCVRSVAHQFFFSNPSTQSLYKKKEREREREREPHINLHIVDRTIPPSIASPGICKIIGHYPDPKSRSAERSLILDTVRMQ